MCTSHFYSQTNDVENEMNEVGEEHGVFVDSYSAALAKNAHWYIRTYMMVSTTMGMKSQVAMN